MPKKVRCPFDITKEFYVVKPFKFGSTTWKPMDDKASFPWRRIGCTERELYRFWNVRLLECKSEENIEGINYTAEPQSTPKKEEIVKEEPELVMEEPEEEPETDEEVSDAKAFKDKPKAEKRKK